MTETIEDMAWFIGTRNNYTHQLVDFLPNLLLRAQEKKRLGKEDTAIIIGQDNKILDACREIPLVKEELANQKVIKLAEIGCPTDLGYVKVRRIRFKYLVYVRFMSIFKSFELIENSFSQMKVEVDNIIGEEECRGSRILYLQRDDERIVNQANIVDLITKKLGGNIAEKLYKLTFEEKIKYLRNYNKILMPPGSDNINGLCFSNKNACLYQMINCDIKNILDNPFYSFAGMRYLLPFLDRVKFIPAVNNREVKVMGRGTWLISDLELSLQKLKTRS